MQREVIELLDDLLPCLPDEEFCVLDDGGVHLLEGVEARHLPKLIEEPAPDAHVLGIEVAGPTRRLEVELCHGACLPQAREALPARGRAPARGGSGRPHRRG